jgi:hypothetical protein
MGVSYSILRHTSKVLSLTAVNERRYRSVAAILAVPWLRCLALESGISGAMRRSGGRAFAAQERIIPAVIVTLFLFFYLGGCRRVRREKSHSVWTGG